MNPRVTWLLPVKNGMPYLPETLASIEKQTYKNWEILVWDNGSTDGTIEELRKWIPSRLPGRVFTEQPLGVGGSLAKMLEECKTEFCARIDADDLNLPNRLEKQVDFLIQHPEIAVLGSQAYFIDAHGNMLDHISIIKPVEHGEIVWSLLARNSIHHPSVLFRRSTVVNIGNYRETPNIEDYELWLRVAATKNRLANLNSCLIKYRFHERSTTEQAIRDKKLPELINECVCQYAASIFGCTENEVKLLRNQNAVFAFKIILKIAKHLEKTQDVKLSKLLRSQSFIESSRLLISPKDIFSRLIVAALDRRRSELPREILRIVRSKIKNYL